MCNFLLSSVPLCKTQALMPFSIPAKKKIYGMPVSRSAADEAGVQPLLVLEVGLAQLGAPQVPHAVQI
jgi:hypothetical protein